MHFHKDTFSCLQVVTEQGIIPVCPQEHLCTNINLLSEICSKKERSREEGAQKGYNLNA
jgi:hypothetical protein